MSTMSYVLFESTSKDLESCIEKLSEACSIKELSPREQEFAKEIAQQAESYIAWYEGLTGDEE